MLNYVNTMIEFNEFIQQELVKRGWSQADLARKSGMTTGGVSMLLNQTRKPSPDTLNSIAQAFNLPLEEIYRVAGLLPPVSKVTSEKEQLLYLFDQLKPEGQEDLISYAHFLLEKQERSA